VDLVHNQGQNLSRLRNLKRCCQYPIDPKNVVIRTQAQADASRPIHKWRRYYKWTRVTGARSVIVRK
jgi:hypothetical protein